MSRFRLRGRSRGEEPVADSPAALGWPAAGVGWPAAARGGPATLAARPAPQRLPTDDPPTDPFGWPAVPAEPAESACKPPLAERLRNRTLGPDPGEAAGLAAAFAVDYLSWDEADVPRRGRVLAGYLRVPGEDPAHLGWSGRGRQRAELALPGRVCPDGAGRVLVDVRVRITPYRPIGSPEPVREPPEELLDQPPSPAVAPAPAGRGWCGLASRWVRLTVPVLRDGDRLVVDEWLPPRDPPSGSDP